LGLHLTEDLDWTTHIELISNKAATGIYMIRKLRPITTATTLKIVYYANVHSQLMYGLIFWGNTRTAAKAFSLQKNLSKPLWVYELGLQEGQYLKPLIFFHSLVFTFYNALCWLKTIHSHQTVTSMLIRHMVEVMFMHLGII
jgi:hypothetical protein